jgi:hypothetical protein
MNMDGEEILKTCARMVRMGIKSITIDADGWNMVKGELLKWLTHSTDKKGQLTVSGIKINVVKQ